MKMIITSRIVGLALVSALAVVSINAQEKSEETQGERVVFPFLKGDILTEKEIETKEDKLTYSKSSGKPYTGLVKHTSGVVGTAYFYFENGKFRYYVEVVTPRNQLDRKLLMYSTLKKRFDTVLPDYLSDQNGAKETKADLDRVSTATGESKDVRIVAAVRSFIPAGHSVVVALRTENKSNNYLISSYLSASNPPALKLVRLNHQKQEVVVPRTWYANPKRLVVRTSGPKEAYMRPNQADTDSFFLSRIFDLSMPGTYILTMSVHFKLIKDTEKGTHEDVEVKVGKLKFSIVP